MDNFWKNKKIIAYIALTHHTRFITPVMEKLARSGATIMYVVGQAEKSQEITAIDCNLDFRHIFEYLSPADDPYIQENYLRLRNRLSDTLISSFALGAQIVTVTDKVLYATAAEYTGFRNLIKEEKPDLCFALHELNRWGKMFSFWAKKMNVPMVTLQEGLYYGLDFGYTGHAQNSTLNLVWGERIKRKLIDFEAPAEKIIPTGNTHLSDEIRHQREHRIREKKRKEYQCESAFVGLLLFSGENPPAAELHPLFKAISSHPEKRLFIKFHPVTKLETIAQWEESIPDSIKTNLRIFHSNENTYDFMSMSDICILVQPSTTGLEALALGKPLVHLDVSMKQDLPYSFVEQGVAVSMTPDQLGEAIRSNLDFSSTVDPQAVADYLNNELTETEGAIDLMIQVFRKMIAANQSPALLPFDTSKVPSRPWSMIIPIADEPKQLLPLLETVALHSENQGEYEVILMEPEVPSEALSRILNSLEGDVLRLSMAEESSLPEMMNQAALEASGETLLFLNKQVVPFPNWLNAVRAGMERHGTRKLFGGRIIDQQKSLVHAGVVLDDNHAPVSAYRHLNGEFPPALKERSFQMLDHFIGIDRTFFRNLGGFEKRSGRYAWMDLCLRAALHTRDADACIFLPEVCMMQLGKAGEETDPDAAIYFFSRWHSVLWENQRRLHIRDKVTGKELHTALISQAQSAQGH